MAITGGGYGRNQLTLNTRKKKKSSKSTNPFLHGSGGPKAEKQIRKANRENASRVTPRSNTNKKRAVKAPSYRAPSPKRATVSSNRKRSSSGGAWSRDGKRYYKNGYVDSKGNRVVNGRWVAPSAKKSSGGTKRSSGSSVKSSAPKTTSTSRKTTTKTASAPKISLLGKDYEDQIYKNQIAELAAAEAAYAEDTNAKVKRTNRDYDLNRANVNLNKTNSLQNSAEDYAARGMMRSGAYQTNLAETTKLFDDQTARMAANFNDDNAEYARAKADFLRGSNTNRQEAKRLLADRIATENAKRTAAGTS